MNIVASLGMQHKSILILFGSMVLVLVGVGDYFVSGEMVEFSVFFLIPIAFFTFFSWPQGGTSGLCNQCGNHHGRQFQLALA